MKRVLLVEPSYRNKYPPLGLMKLSSYHKLRGDYVKFVKGLDSRVRAQTWDRIYISTLFTFYWKSTVDTIKYYERCVNSPEDIIAGGVMATLLSDELIEETGIRIIRGLLNEPGVLDSGDRTCIDSLVPDYQILSDIDYTYGLQDAYLGYATRGCPNDCSFCAVNRIEPEFIHYLPLKRQVESIESIHGPKQNLILLDNNVLASNQFEKVIDDILELGFHAGATMNRRMRCVDFNQGIDLRLLTPEKAKLLAKIALRPMRLAFDTIKLKELYTSRVNLALDEGLQHISNYVLYNYDDTPEDFYERLKLVVLLNEERQSQIWSFPMKYVPLDARDRTYVGPHWNRRILRGIQCILLATKGMVSPKKRFFEAAFGSSPEDFIEIASMPDEYIIHREKHKLNGADEWRRLYRSLTDIEMSEFIEWVNAPNLKHGDHSLVRSSKVRNLLSHYLVTTEEREAQPSFAESVVASGGR